MAGPVLHALDLKSLPPDEMNVLRGLVEGVPGVSHQILSVYRRGPDELEVIVGSQSGPLVGDGHVLYLERRGGRWAVNHDRTCTWES